MTQQLQPNDHVRNINPRSIHHGKTGVFRRIYERWTFAGGLACDVCVEGESGPYGYPSVIMSVGDLVLDEQEAR